MSDPLIEPAALLSANAPFPLHLLGWKAFQDLCVGVAEECLRRPVQSFLPNNDAGRDGAFVGRWDGDDPAAGESTIQCKFTSKLDSNLSLSMLSDELDKAAKLAALGLASDYIILTNHPVTGASELAIKAAFEAVGVGRCRIFGADWITRQIRTSPRLRMMAPRLYGLGNLNDLLDGRAYKQAQLILSAMGDDLQRLVVTDAHRRSVRAISAHNMVLLLGAPAAGKSTIGASIAIGAADIWKSSTIRATCPEDIQRHLSSDGSQFFWIDDAWGNTQYQRHGIEAWNQIFPLMNGAMRRGTRFLITSRDYIWNAAKRDLKIPAMPALGRSQVVINVQELSGSEKAQILYNHLKLGDQPKSFLSNIKSILPAIAERSDFLPETARRLGSTFFAKNLPTDQGSITRFFAQPQSFLQDTIASLSAECRAAIAVVFLNGGAVRSPVSSVELSRGADVFGATPSAVRDELQSLNGSLLLLAQDEAGPYWTYKHPTVSDAFAKYVSGSPELVEVYLRGAKPESIIYEVICAGAAIANAPVIVPTTLHDLLAQRIEVLDNHYIRTFLSYRSNAAFSALMIAKKPAILETLWVFAEPIKDDSDAQLLAALHSQGVLPEDLRRNFFEKSREALLENADVSALDEAFLRPVLTTEERKILLEDVSQKVLPRVAHYVKAVRSAWNSEYSPEDHFEALERSFEAMASSVSANPFMEDPLIQLRREIATAVSEMESEYEEPSSTSAPVSSSVPKVSGLQNLFRDVDE